MSQNKSLYDVMKVITDRMKSDNFWRFAKEKTTGLLHHLGPHIDEHEMLVNAIANHDEKEAEKAMKQHLRSVEKGLLQFF
jgi:GntR family transcriptional repressor for pyruvate dehydrogenase complex